MTMHAIDCPAYGVPIIRGLCAQCGVPAMPFNDPGYDMGPYGIDHATRPELRVIDDPEGGTAPQPPPDLAAWAAGTLPGEGTGTGTGITPGDRTIETEFIAAMRAARANPIPAGLPPIAAGTGLILRSQWTAMVDELRDPDELPSMDTTLAALVAAGIVVIVED